MKCNGIDSAKKNGLEKALQENDALRYIAASDAAGRFMMAASEFDAAVLSGQKIQNQADLNEFIVNASAEKR